MGRDYYEARGDLDNAVQWRVVVPLKGGIKGRPTNLDCNVLFFEFNSL